MASLPDHTIRDLCRTRGLVEPFNPDLVNPASIDVTLGDTILVEVPHGFHEIDISDHGVSHGSWFFRSCSHC